MGKIYIRVIQSSSKGNCIVLFDGLTHLFLDFGCKAQFINNYINKYSVTTEKIAGCLITHEHIDHIYSVNENIGKNIKFYAVKEIMSIFANNINVNLINTNNKKWIRIKNSDWSFKFFQTIHNSAFPIGFIIKNRNKKLVYITDTQYFYNKKLKNMTAYIIESNFQTEFTHSNIKKYIHSSETRNHLNLTEAENLLNKYVRYKTKLFLFSHLSNKNKSNELIDKIVKKYNNKNCFVSYIHPHLILKDEYNY